MKIQTISDAQTDVAIRSHFQAEQTLIRLKRFTLNWERPWNFFLSHSQRREESRQRVLKRLELAKREVYIKITGATVLQNTKGTDSVILYTDLPNGIFPYEGTASVEVKVASGGGEEWMKSNLPNVSFSVIDV